MSIQWRLVSAFSLSGLAFLGREQLEFMACRMRASMFQCGQQFATPAGSVCVCVYVAAFPRPSTRLSTRNPRFSPAKLSQLKLGTFPGLLRTHDSHSGIATQRFNSVCSPAVYLLD